MIYVNFTMFSRPLFYRTFPVAASTLDQKAKRKQGKKQNSLKTKTIALCLNVGCINISWRSKEDLQDKLNEFSEKQFWEKCVIALQNQSLTENSSRE